MLDVGLWCSGFKMAFGKPWNGCRNCGDWLHIACGEIEGVLLGFRVYDIMGNHVVGR